MVSPLIIDTKLPSLFFSPSRLERRRLEWLIWGATEMIMRITGTMMVGKMVGKMVTGKMVRVIVEKAMFWRVTSWFLCSC